MRTEIIDSIERLRELRSAWTALLEDSASRDIFLTPEWLFPWWETFGGDLRLFFISFWREDNLRALFPLCGFHRRGARVISFPGAPSHADRMDFIVARGDEEECLGEFAQFLCSRRDWDFLSLRHFSPFAGNAESLCSRFRSLGREALTRPDNRCPYIPCGDYEGYDDFLKQGRRQRTRKNLRRKQRRIEAWSGSAWSVENELTADLIEEAARLDSEQSVRGASGQAFFSNPSNKQFLLRLGEELSDRGWLWLHSLRIGGVLRSYVLSFIYDQRFLSYQCAFDRDFSKHSVGVINLVKTVACALNMGMREFDFLSGDQPYKLEWTDRIRENKRLYVFNKGAKGFLLYVWHKHIAGMRKFLRRIL
jgi:CelD/BcsL family acetyltransferase involved in cellulose biosynthesis